MVIELLRKSLLVERTPQSPCELAGSSELGPLTPESSVLDEDDWQLALAVAESLRTAEGLAACGSSAMTRAVPPVLPLSLIHL